MSHSTSRSEIIRFLEAILSAQNEGQWDKLESLVQPTVVVNNNSLQRETFITHLRSDAEVNNTASKLESSVVDVNAQAIAARVIKTQAIPPEETSAAQLVQYQEIMLAWFIDGRLSAIKSIRDNDARRATKHSAMGTPSHLLENSNPTAVDLDSIYRQYIGSINEKTMEATFENFCKPLVTHNTHEKTIAEYISLIQESQEAIQGLYFDIQDLIVDKGSGRVAARLEFTGVPIKTWANAKPNGRGVKFHEHVMYWFDEGKIHWVWSIVDLDTYREQCRAKN
ncbi:polyketide cyclase [Fusarium sporotrichioides]|uniref:Polyketide cyclase n=1 Tax=Fusarium sporotrichioides TaxID=5514 RepID=A0A395SR95_FUSSP|nr:polyketide cyclase [Fusarium sporotrichioides]